MTHHCRLNLVPLFLSCAALLAAAGGPSAARAQTMQQLSGDYLGLVANAVNIDNTNLKITNQTNRQFTGSLSFIEQENLLVKGTIAASGNCTIQATGDDGKTTLKLDWQDLSGAGVLTGQVVILDLEEPATGPIAFLRPFANPGVNWSDGPATAEFRSHTGGVNAGVSIDFLSGAKGLFNTGFSLGGESFEIIGTSNTDSQVVAVGVSGSFVITIAGQVKINERGEPTEIEATYLIETSGGKLVDAGIMVIAV